MASLGGGGKDRVVAWARAKWIPLLAGGLCLALVGVLVANARAVPASVTTQASGVPSATMFHGRAQPSPAHRSPTGKTVQPGWSAAVGTGVTLGVPSPAGAPPVSATGVSPVEAAVVGGFPGAPAADATVGRSVAGATSFPAVALSTPATIYLPAVSSPTTTPAVVPVVAAPVVPLTIAQQTAANAAAAAAETARVASAADAYAVAHPAG